MSVWKASCYRDDALQNLASSLYPPDLDCPFIYSLCDFDVEPCGDYLLPGGIVPGNLRDQVIGRPEVLKQILEPRKSPGGYPSSFAAELRTLPKAIFGVHAVYKFVQENWNVFTGPKQESKRSASFFDQTFAFGYAASYRTGQEAKDKAATIRGSIQRYVEGPYDAIRTLISVGVKGAGRDYKRACHTANVLSERYPELEGAFPTWINRYRIYWYRSVLILVNEGTDRTYVLTRDDIDRIERFVLGIAWSGYYLAEYSDSDENLRERLKVAFEDVKKVIRDSLSKVDKKGANSLCRSYDVALWKYCAELAQDVTSDALNQQNEKIRREDLGRFVDQNALLRIANRFPMREALEILQIYKAFPQPDFDYFGATYRQEELYKTVKPFGKDAENENTGQYEDLFRYFTFTLIRAYHKRHGICPGHIKEAAEHKRWHDSYPHIPPEKIPVDQVDDIDIGNTFRYAAHGTDIMDLVQDKAICPDNIRHLSTVSDVRFTNVDKKNYLMNVLAAPEPIVLSDLHNREVFDDVKAEDKPEAKKPNGRWFFEGHTERRLLQSEYELSVAEYAKNTAGCMSGKSTRDKISTMNYICELQHGANFSPYRPLLISFDLEKFSPMLGMDYHKKTDLIFANAFGQPHLANASDVFTKGKIHYIKRNVHHSFDKPGRDFEGFSGRKNTIYHCAVMGYCIKRLRALNLIDAGGRFASLIDDGLLRLVIRKDKYAALVPKVLEVIEDVYKMANLYISWDKTFISEHFSVFLNEFNYKGTPVTPGIRSFLKITSRAEGVCPSLPDDLAKLESTCRGAIAAGAPANLTYGAYCFHVMDLLNKWSKGTVTYSGKLALAQFLPVALGGFAINSVASLSGSVMGPGIVEGIGNVRAIAVRFRQLVPAINKMINVPMRQLSDEEKLRAPTAVRRQGRCLKTTRGKQVLERRLVHMLDTPVIRALLGDVSIRQDDSAIAALVHRGQVPVEALELIHDSTIGSAVSTLSAKFLRARTAFKLVRPSAFARATVANFTEARALIHEWR